MKKYGEIFIDEPISDGSVAWLARWYEGDELIETKEGKAKDNAAAEKDAGAWLKAKGEQ